MRKAVVSALDEAARQGRDAADAGDLLTVIAGDRESAGAYLLEQSGVRVERILRRGGFNTPDNGSASQRASRLDDSALRILRDASQEATRLHHDHVGTEHVVAAMSRADDLELGKKLNEAGLTPDHAEAAMRRWFAEGMPRRRGAWTARRPGLLGAVLRPLQRVVKIPRLAWNVYVRKSLGHPRFVSDPYPLYRWLREHEPVRKDPLAPVWVLTRYDDVMEMLRDPRYRKDTFAIERLPELVREQLDVETDEARVEIGAVSMLFLDPPRHTRVRAAFSRAFTPASLAQLRPRIELIASKRIERVAASGQMDVIADLAYPLPVIVIAELLGFPPEDYPRIKKWSDDFAASLSLNATSAQQTQAGKSREEIREYFDEVVVQLKKKPQDTLLSRLLESEDDSEGLNREEIFSNCVLLLSAGHETTTNLIGNGMLALLRDRDQWELLARQPELIESAVDELLRFDSPVQWTSRVSGEGIKVGGQTIPSGEIVLGCVGAANRDPTKFIEPDRLDIRRTDNKHLSFGTGIHFCIGAALARMEAQIAIGQLAQRFPRMELAEKKVNWLKGLTFRGVTRLPVKLNDEV
jgi:cytochrome P450